jgi:2-keto-4-pentenoate hydratase/2-oxohepta-3-ene-1,7-dioic acid hydratase in catechol pathway
LVDHCKSIFWWTGDCISLLGNVMKLVRYKNESGKIQFGCQHPDGTTTVLAGDPFQDFTDTGIRANVLKILSPVLPSDIFCIGLNYRRHAQEGNFAVPEYPVVFMKNTGSVQHPGDPILLPTHLRSEAVDFECELAVIIKKECYNVPKEQAMDYVLGFTCANDVSARDWQTKFGGGQWCRGKTFATFCPLGPCIVTTDEIKDLAKDRNGISLRIQTDVSGETMQDWNTNDMIFDIPSLIEFLSGSTRLIPGTVILTGTPHGVGFARKPPRFLQPGDTVQVTIEGIGTLSNPVMSE